MILRPLALSLVLLLAGCAEPEAPPAVSQADASGKPRAFDYPAAKMVDQADDYFDQRIFDPYRWMEDLDSPELAQWVAAQNALTQSYLADAPGRERIKARLTELWNYERYGVPQVRGGRYFYTRNDGLQNQAPVYWQAALDAEPTLLLDPNTLSADGTVSLADWEASDDGKRLAYALSDGGSDWRTIKVRDVDSGQDLADEIRWAKFTSIAWARDGSGFYYSRYDAPQGENELKAVNKFQKLYFHRLGTPQDQDRLVYERPDQPDWGFQAEVSDDGHHLVVTVSKGTDERNLLFVQDLRKADAPMQEIVSEFRAAYDFIGAADGRLFVRTDDGAERYRIVAIDPAKPAQDDWREVVPQAEATLLSANVVGGQVIANRLRDAASEVTAYDLKGKRLRTIALPGLGTATGFGGGASASETFFAFASFTTPGTILRYEPKSGRVAVFREPKVAFDPAAYETRQVFYPSKDGTKIPMFITARRGVTLDGDNPTLLYGYGGFNIPVTPAFSANTIAWLELGGVYASANLRGGGEYGRAWHEAGMKTRRQNVFDDFAAAAEYLIAEKWTQPERLAISGRSNGGLLVAATMLQRPELFGAALPAVSVLDMLRFREFTIGWAWESDYGSVKDPAEFKALLAYSPLHNIRPKVEYPATLVTTADRDDRVFPAHSFKFAAALQAAYQGERPMLIRVETRAGHGAGKPTSKIIGERADEYAFLVKTLGIELPPAAAD
ncbi:MAG: prolyl oligopeptidase family serine peptidase [Xanthomonadaceae bacterium]|jgi:prolyl oligopeptidase|nr:prolyl oligopeptidase family serine peptidase [Xanthomonadaceae bacterium]